MSKIIERLVAFRLLRYLEDNHLMPKKQSGFQKGHSTETLLVRVLSDIHDAMCSCCPTLLALLDVGATFDTVDHDSPRRIE